MTTQRFIEVEQRDRRIRGMAYLPDGAGRRPAVLMMHGFTGQRTESGFLFVSLARRLAERGVAAVTFDFLNSGESDGSFDQMLVTEELADAMRMTQWLAGQPFADRSRLGLLGFSLGGLLAGCVCGRTDVYRAVVMLAPTTERNLSRYAEQKADEGARTAEGRVIVGPHVLHADFFDDLATLDSVGDCVRHPRPTLLVQGDADKAVTPAVSARFVDAMRRAGVPIDHHLLADADHGFSHPTVRAELIDLVSDWLVDRL